jgi:hypothetical protein
MVKAILVFGSKTWALTELDLKRLGTGERKILRRIHGLMIDQGIWRKSINQELRELYKYVDTVVDLKNILEWVGHVEGISQMKGT